ncbi:MAG: thioredoxin [Saprospiraceae bacterium]
MFWKKKEKTINTVTATDANFDEIVTSSKLPVLVDFWAPWCGPCRILGPLVDELAMEFKERVVVAKVNVDGNPGLSQHFKVKSIPTIIFVKNGKLVERISGMVPKPNLAEMLEDLIVLGVENEEEE